MYRVLIVDDEPIIADGLYEELTLCDGLDVDAYRTYSGKGALAMLEKHRIDIVITDIKMPGMDGMVLLERIRGNWPQCRVIFLTGHKEFDYVYTAIQYKGLQYVLKSEGYARVISALRAAIAEIDGELRLSNQQDAMQQRMESATMFLQRDFVQRLLERRSADINEQDLHEFGIGLQPGEPVFLALGRINFPADYSGHAGIVKYLYSIKLAAEQFLAPRLQLACVPDEQYDIMLFLQPGRLAEQPQDIGRTALWDSAVLFVKETLELMQASVKARLNCTLSFAMAAYPVPWSGIAAEYGLLKRLVDLRIGKGDEMLLTESSPNLDKLSAAEPEQAGRIKQKVESLSACLDRGEREEYRKAFDNLAATLQNASGMQNVFAQELYYSIALMLLSHLNRWQLAEKISPAVDPGMLLNSGKFSSWQNAAGYLWQISSSLFDIQQVDQDKRAADILKRLKTYIDGHLGDELSLLKLSELMYFNPSYLSRLFKQLSGENLTDYIQDKRIAKAREMLGRNDLRINDIAVAVGFGSATNFTRFFKKATGTTPAEYRDRISASKAGIEM